MKDSELIINPDGSIYHGTQCAYALALGMDVIGFDPYISVEAAWGLARTVRRATSLDQLLAQSDYITLHVPLMDATKGLLGREKFAIMKKGVRIVNLARGGLVKSEVSARLLPGNASPPRPIPSPSAREGT